MSSDAQNNIKLIVSYEGTAYLGWQKTAMGPSIEASLERVLEQVLQETIQLQAASRTDAGVHAASQVVNFKTNKNIDLRRLQHSLNYLLPKDISITFIENTLTAFHPTLDACGKEYHYHLCNNAYQLPFHRHFSWHFPQCLSQEKMVKGAKMLIGEYDFSAFCNRLPAHEASHAQENRVRRIDSIEILPLPHHRLRISVKGNHFLYKMVRNIVGTLVYVGCGKIPVEALFDILQSRDRTRAGVTAPAHG